MKKPYEVPKITAHGDVRDLTRGSRSGYLDLLWGDDGGFGIFPGGGGGSGSN